MNYTPVNEEEYKTRNLWPVGWYACTVSKAEEGRSQKSNDAFFKCEMHVFNENGSFRPITAYIMAEGKAAFQLREAAEAFGLLELYKSGALQPHDLESRNGFVRLGIEEDETGKYDPKNVIKAYRAEPPKAKVKKGEAPAAEQPLSDEIPF